jgi:hypothetical protein
MPLLANAASYEVVELPTRDLSVNQFGTVIDETGLMLTTLNQPYNPPVDLSLLDLSVFPLTDPDGAAQGNFNDADYNLIGSFLYTQTANRSVFGQKLAAQIGYQTDGTEYSYVNGFDIGSEGTNGFTFAQRTTLGDSVNGTHIVGTMAGVFNEIPFTTAEGVELLFTVNDFGSRAFVQVGDKVVALLPDELSAGGVSAAEAINDNLQIAGSIGISLIASLQTAVDNCLDEELRGDQPVEVCLYSIRAGTATSASQFQAATERRAVIWQVDSTGDLIDKTVYGLAFEPDAENTVLLSTQAVEINNAGVAVGTSAVPIGSSFTQAAVAFENGETIRLIEDDNLLPNIATNINDNGYIVGYQNLRVGTATRSKMFVINRNTEDFLFSNGFFVNSSTIPSAINNNNIVVGSGESEGGQTTRRRSGFVYDIEADTFTNVNSLIACNSGYDIVGLNDINNSNEIIGDALVKRPVRNIRGVAVNDSNGDPVLVDAVVAVKLVPTGEAPSVCELTDEESASVKRQGAGVGILTMFSLLIISLFRRRENSI